MPLRIWALHLAYAERQEPEVLAALVEQYASRAVSCARRFERQGEPIEDLVQVAYEALVKALKRFDPELGLPFAALATPTIEGALKRHFRDRGYLLHAPRKVHESLALVRWGSEHLHNELQREPTDQEVAAFVHLSVADVRRVGEAERARRLASLDSAPLDPPERRRSSDAFDRAEDHDTVLRLLRPLEPHEREVVYLYYFEGLSQAAIASRFDVSQMQVSRWLAATLARIRSNAA